MLEVIAIGFGAVAVVAAAVPLFRTKEQTWVRSRRSQGASTEQIFAEKNLREHLVILRENVSNFVHSPGGVDGWIDFLHSEIKVRMYVLNFIDPDLSKRFLQVVSGLKHSDILYPDAYDKVYPQPTTVSISPDQRAYWNRIRDAAYTDL